MVDVVSTASSGLSPSAAARLAFDQGAMLLLRSGEVAALSCNPAAGDDFKAMVMWAAGHHFVPRDATLYILLARGLHPINTHIIIDYGRYVDIRGANTRLFTIESATVGRRNPDGSYPATIRLTAPVPDHIVPGYPFGVQQAQSRGSSSIFAMNGCHKVKGISPDRMGIALDFVTSGDTPRSVPASQVDLVDGGNGSGFEAFGLPKSQVAFPDAALLCNGDGWNGGAIEGFLNVHDGGRVRLSNIGFAYDGEGGNEDDMLFVSGAGSQIHGFDRVFVVGGGDKVLRASAAGQFKLNRCYIGGGTTAMELYQGISGSNLFMSRCMLGGARKYGLAMGDDSHAFLTGCFLCSVPIGAFLTYGTSGVVIGASYVANCQTAINTLHGTAQIGQFTNILQCGTPLTRGQGRVVVLAPPFAPVKPAPRGNTSPWVVS